jgi:hypothetical protein
VEAIVFMVVKGSQDIIQYALVNGMKDVGGLGVVTQVDIPLTPQYRLKSPCAKVMYLVTCILDISVEYVGFRTFE